MQMFEPSYLPKDHFREIARAKNTAALLYLYYALQAGLRPMLDDWVPTQNLDDFIKACKEYGFHVFSEMIFIKESRKALEMSVGSKYLTTTLAYGVPVSSRLRGGVHIFVSKSESVLDKGRSTGWYTNSINGRIINKPLSEHIKFGEFLGYPKCCIEFFRRYNDHTLYRNTLYRPYLNTLGKTNWLCNSLTKDSYSYDFNIPCSFSCIETARQAAKLRNAIIETDKNYAEIIDLHMKQVFLVFRERDIYAFIDGKIEGDKLRYKGCYYLDHAIYEPKFLDCFRRGNGLRVTDDKIEIFKDDEVIWRMDKTYKEQGFLISFLEHG
jgi:hypothetical protein